MHAIGGFGMDSQDVLIHSVLCLSIAYLLIFVDNLGKVYFQSASIEGMHHSIASPLYRPCSH